MVTSTCLGVEEGLGEQQRLPSSSPVVSECSLAFEHWRPAAAADHQALPQPLRLPVDKDFAESTFRVQVIGLQGGASFAVPAVFEVDGREVAGVLSVERQRLEYVARHRARHAQGGEQRATVPSGSGSAEVASQAAAASGTVSVSSSTHDFWGGLGTELPLSKSWLEALGLSACSQNATLSQVKAWSGSSPCWT